MLRVSSANELLCLASRDKPLSVELLPVHLLTRLCLAGRCSVPHWHRKDLDHRCLLTATKIVAGRAQGSDKELGDILFSSVPPSFSLHGRVPCRCSRVKKQNRDQETWYNTHLEHDWRGTTRAGKGERERTFLRCVLCPFSTVLSPLCGEKPQRRKDTVEVKTDRAH